MKTFRLFLAACCTTAAAQTPQAFVEQNFYRKIPSAKCLIGQKGNTCMQLKQTGSAEGLTFLLYTGDNVKLRSNSRPVTLHAPPYPAEIFVLKQNNGTWQLKARSQTQVEAAESGGKPWRFLRFGTSAWGFENSISGGRQGYNNFFSSLFVYSGGKFDSYLIITGMDNTEAGTSDEEVSLHGTLTPRPDLKQTAGRYPLEIRLTGKKGKNTFKGQSYLLPFKARNNDYSIPENYPVSGF